MFFVYVVVCFCFLQHRTWVGSTWVGLTTQHTSTHTITNNNQNTSTHARKQTSEHASKTKHIKQQKQPLNALKIVKTNKNI